MEIRLKRFLSLAMAIVMVIGMMPTNIVFATENGEDTPLDQNVVEETTAATSEPVVTEHTCVYTAEEVTKAATCTETGSKTLSGCSCGVNKTEEISALGHSHAEEVTKEATCTETGVKTFTCGTCGDTYTEEIPEAEHSYKAEDGKCECGAVCEHVWTDEEREVSNGSCLTCGYICKHDGETHVETIPATCTEPGCELVVCDICTASIAGTELPKADHVYVDGVCSCNAVAPDGAFDEGNAEGDEVVTQVQEMLDALPDLPPVVKKAELEAYQAKVNEITAIMVNMTKEQTDQLTGLEKLYPNVTLEEAALPQATVTVLDPMVLKPDVHEYMVWPSGDSNVDRPLQIVMNFKAKDTIDQATASGYGKYKCDFYLTVSDLANGSLTADGCYLAGNYGEFGWIVIPADGMEIENGVTYPVVSGYDANITYEQICGSVKDFTAAIFIHPDLLAAHPDMKVQLELKMVNPENSEEVLVIGEPAVYDVEDLLAGTPKDEPEEPTEDKAPIVIPENIENTITTSNPGVAEDVVTNAVDEIKNNTALKEESYNPIQGVANVVAFEVSLKDMKLETKDDTTETVKITFNVEPKDANGQKVSVPSQAITFRLPIPSSWDGQVKVYHENDLMGTCDIQGSGNSKYVEVSSADFSEFAVEPVNEGPTTISNLADLLAFAEAVNGGDSYEGKTVTLTTDLTMTGEWTPIGTGSRSSKTYTGNAFKGTFDGGNHTITGLTITSTTGADAAVGLFGVVDGGTVKNLTLANVNINVSSSDLAGAAIGMMVNGATAENITVSGAVTGNDGVGGIVGRMIISGTIKGCTNNASVTSSYGGIGGIVGKAYYEDGSNTSLFANITNCTNNGTITAPMYVGGIAGLARANVTNCVNNGAVVGGTQTGGIVGQLMAAGDVSGNENKAKISGENHLGGIIGDYSQTGAYNYNNVTINNNINRGELAATEQYAAIMGCNNIDGFTGMKASGNKSYYYVDGLVLFGNPEDMVIDDSNKFTAPRGTLGMSYIGEDTTTADRYRVYGEILNVYANESIKIELYSGETLIASTELNPETYNFPYEAATLGMNLVISGKASGSWKTEWEEGHPISTACPDKAILYIDNQNMGEATVTLATIDNLGTPYVWADIPGVYTPPMGSDFNGYTDSDRIWGEVWSNATKSHVIKILDADGKVMGTTSLNPELYTFAGDQAPTWHICLDPSTDTDEYWIQEWTTAPTLDNMPAKVELWVDGVKVSGGDVVLHGPDQINKIVALVADGNGMLKGAYKTVADAFAAAFAAKGAQIKIVSEDPYAQTDAQVNFTEAGTYTVTGGNGMMLPGIFMQSVGNVNFEIKDAYVTAGKLISGSGSKLNTGSSIKITNSIVDAGEWSGDGFDGASWWTMWGNSSTEITNSTVGANIENGMTGKGGISGVAFGANNARMHFATAGSAKINGSTVISGFFQAADRGEIIVDDSNLYIGGGLIIGRDAGGNESWHGTSADGFRADKAATVKVTDSKIVNIGWGNGNDGKGLRIGSLNIGNLVLDNSDVIFSHNKGKNCEDAYITAGSTLTMSNNSTLVVGTLNVADGAVITIDASAFAGGENLKVIEQTDANAASLERKVKVNNLPDCTTVSYEDGDVTLVAVPPVAQIGERKYATFADALNAVQDGQTITLVEGTVGDESKTKIEFNKAISFTITGKAPEYVLPVVTFQNATVNIQGAEIKTAELDARQNATINVIDSTVHSAGGNPIVKSYYNGAINISGTSKVYTHQMTTMGYITISDSAQVHVTWKTNVYGNGMITVKNSATLATASLQLTGQDYSGRDNTDADRAGKPATIIVDGANFTVGKVFSEDGKDYSYETAKYGINIGTEAGKSAVLDIKNGANVQVYQFDKNNGNNYLHQGIVTIGAGGTVNVDGSTFSVACRQENGEVTLTNNGRLAVQGNSKLNISTLTGTAVYVTDDATLTDTVIGGGDKANIYAGYGANKTGSLKLTISGSFTVNALYVGDKTIENYYTNGEVHELTITEGAVVNLGSLYVRPTCVATVTNATVNTGDLYVRGSMTVDGSTMTQKPGVGGGTGHWAVYEDDDATKTASLTLNNSTVSTNYLVVGSNSNSETAANSNAKLTVNGGSLTLNDLYVQGAAAFANNVASFNNATLNAKTAFVHEKAAVLVSGTSDIAANVTGAGWVYMNGVTTSSATKLNGAKVRFTNGTNNINGSVIDDGWFQVGIGEYHGTDTRAEKTDVIVNVNDNAVIGCVDNDYRGWIGTGYFGNDDDKAAAMTDAKYILNINNSTAHFGYLHISNDGELNVNGEPAELTQYNGSTYGFHAGRFIINGTANFDDAAVWASSTNVSNDNGTDKPGTLNIKNGTAYEIEMHNGSYADTNFKLSKTGVVNVEGGSTVEIGEATSIAANAKLNITDAVVNALGAITHSGTINLAGDSTTKLTAPSISGAGPIIIDASKMVAGDIPVAGVASGYTGGYKAINNEILKAELVDGKIILVGAVAVIGDDLYWTLQDAVDAVEDGQTITLIDDITFTKGANGSTNGISVTHGVSFDIDMNGKTVSSNLGGNALRFKIGDGNDVKNTNVTINVYNGKVISGDANWTAISAAVADNSGNKLTLNLTDLEVENSRAGDYAIKSWAGAVVNANNVDVTSSYGGSFYAAGGEMVLDNCTATQTGMHTAPYLSMAVAVSSGGKMTVNSGNYSTVPAAATDGNNQGSSHGCWAVGVMNSGGTLIINGGTFANGNVGEDSLATTARGAVLADTGAVVEINGGTFNALKDIIDYQNNLGNAAKNPVIDIYGGAFSAPIPNEYCGDGYAPVDYGNGYHGVKVNTDEAAIGDKTYATLAAAVAAASEGDTIVLRTNVTVGTDVEVEENITISGNGTYSIRTAGNGALHITGKNNNLTLDKVTADIAVYADASDAGATVNGKFVTGISAYKSNAVSDGTNVTVTNPSWNVEVSEGKFFMSLQDAINAAQDGDTITLLNDVIIDETLDVSFNSDYDTPINVTIEGNGKTIKASDTFASKYMMDAAWNVTLQNVTFDGNNKTNGGVQFYCSTSTVNNVAFKNLTNGPSWAVPVHVSTSDVDIKGTIEMENCKNAYISVGVGSNLPPHIAAESNVDTTATSSDVVVGLDGATATVIPGASTTGNMVAKVGDKHYSSLANAITAAKSSDTVTMLNDVTENVTVTQAPDYAITIDGNGKTLFGTITVDGKSQTYLTSSVTIKNVNFDVSNSNTDACISLGVKGDTNTRYTCNVTVENCTFTDNDKTAAAVRSHTGGDKNLKIIDCVVNEGMHSLVQIAGIDGVVIDDCEVYSKNGINLNSSENVEIKNSTIDVSGYAVRAGASSGGASGKITLTDNTLKTDNSEGDAVVTIRGTAAQQIDLTMTKNVVSGGTHISGTTTDTKVSANGNYWDGKEVPVVSGTAVEVDNYYIDAELTQLGYNTGNEINMSEFANDAGQTIKAGGEIHIDGMSFHLTDDLTVEIPEELAKKSKMLITTYQYTTPENGKPYPSAMYVWLATGEDANDDKVYENYRVERVSALDDFFLYHGTSIRIDGSNNGIRFISSIDPAIQNALINGNFNGLAGAKMISAGTEFWRSEDNKQRSEVYGGAAGSNFRVFMQSEGRNWFTGVLTNLGHSDKIIVTYFNSRPYAVLEIGNEQITLYGGVLTRSIYDVAKQNTQKGTPYYDYVTDLIARGDAYRADNGVG